MDEWPYISMPRPEFTAVVTNLQQINLMDFPEVIEKLPARARMQIVDAMHYVRAKHPLEIEVSAFVIDLLTEKFLDLGLSTGNPFVIDDTVVVLPGD